MNLWDKLRSRWGKPLTAEAVSEAGRLVALLRPAVQKRVDNGMTFNEACDDIEKTLHLGVRMENVRAVLRREF